MSSLLDQFAMYFGHEGRPSHSHALLLLEMLPAQGPDLLFETVDSRQRERLKNMIEAAAHCARVHHDSFLETRLLDKARYLGALRPENQFRLAQARFESPELRDRITLNLACGGAACHRTDSEKMAWLRDLLEIYLEDKAYHCHARDLIQAHGLTTLIRQRP